MDMRKKISVIVPVFNVENYLDRCIKSIVSQTYKNLEIILVDDGSTDKSGIICDEFSKRDLRVQVIHKKNGGQNSARKAGILAAKGDYIAFVDSDDWIESDLFEVLHKNSNNADLVTSKMFIEENENRIIVADGLQVAYYSDMDYVLRNFFINHAGVGAGLKNNMVARLWRTTIVMSIVDKMDIDIRIGEDWFFTFIFLLNSTSVNVLDYCGYHYVSNPNSAMHTQCDSYLIEQNRLYFSVKNNLKDFYLEKEMFKDFQIRFMNDLFGLLPVKFGIDYKFRGIRPDLIEFLVGKRICLFGAGKLGRFYFNNLIDSKCIEIVLWCDNKPDANKPLYSVSSPDCIRSVDFDYVLVAVAKKEAYKQIESQLLSMEIPVDKVLWVYQAF